ncbi:MAG: S41 family peptidase [Dehalococcoidia bacterium]
MTPLKQFAIGKLFLIVLVVGVACGTTQAVTTSTPTSSSTSGPVATSTPVATPVSSVKLPDDARSLFEAWRIIMQDFVGIEEIDPRVLSDGAIFGLLDVVEGTTISISQARDISFELENADNYFNVDGGDELREVYEVWAYAYTNKLDPGIEPFDLNEAAIDGMIAALADPYTAFLSPDDLRLDQEDLRGRFEGIGAFVRTNDEGYVIVVAPMENTPAEAAGILAGDTILEVDGEPTNSLSLRESILKIRGPKGTDVELLVKHLLDGEIVLITITRGDIPVASVRVSMVTDDIARIRIEQFTRRTPDETEQAIREAQDLGAKALILDVRRNPGGLLVETVQVADHFLSGGLVLFEEDGDGRRTDWTARPGGVDLETPLVVLVDQFSASGAEVLAGALQDRNRATVIGAQTFGKGSVTHLRGLTDGSGLYITFARWFTPLGQIIEGEGITPDIEVLFTEADAAAQRDPQLEAAIEHLEAIIGSDT